jgi:hypothetical protein
MVEMIGNKEVVNVQPAMFFTVTIATNKRPIHVLVRAESAIGALVYAEKILKAPAIGCHVTEFSDYLDSLEIPDAEIIEPTKENVK